MNRTAWAVVCCFALSLALSAGAALAQERISLELRDADVQSALTMLFKDSGKNFVLEGGAAGTVNVSLRDVPWEQALRAVLESANLTWAKEDDTYHIRAATSALPPAPARNEIESRSRGRALTSSNLAVSRAPTSQGPMFLGIVPVLHASVVDMATWFGGAATLSGAIAWGGATQYGTGAYGPVSPALGVGGGTGALGLGTGAGGYGTGTLGYSTGAGELSYLPGSSLPRTREER